MIENRDERGRIKIRDQANDDQQNKLKEFEYTDKDMNNR
jgi:hypothetical protein